VIELQKYFLGPSATLMFGPWVDYKTKF